MDARTRLTQPLDASLPGRWAASAADRDRAAGERGAGGRGIDRWVGSRLREARISRGLAPSDVAEFLGVSDQQCRSYEVGAARLPADMLLQLADFLGVQIGALYGASGGESAAAGPALADGSVLRMMQAFNALDARDREMLVALAVRLKAARTPASPPEPVHEAAAPRPRRILLVDDNEDVLRLTGTMLAHAGYDVVRASSGDDALAALAREAPFDVLVTDHAMPALTGAELVELALERQPGLAVIVMTGYGSDPRLLALPDRVGILVKPFSQIDLVRLIEPVAAASPAP